MAKTALVVLASGAEEMETVAAVDVMRRGEVSFIMRWAVGNDLLPCVLIIC